MPSNTGFLRWLVAHPSVQDGSATTRFIDEVFAGDSTNQPPVVDLELAAAAAAGLFLSAEAADRRSGNLWEQVGPYRATPHQAEATITLIHRGEQLQVVPTDPAKSNPAKPLIPTAVDLANRLIAINVDGNSLTFAVPTAGELVHAEQEARHEDASALVAPFPAVVVEVAAVAGSEVLTGDTLVVIEAMKMLHTLAANGDGTIAAVSVSEGDTVESGAVLVTFESTPEQDPEITSPNDASPKESK